MLTSHNGFHGRETVDMSNSSHNRNIALAWLFLLTVVWGSAFSFMHYLLLPSPGQPPLLPPMTLVLLRQGIAGIVLIPFMRGFRPRPRDLMRYGLAGFIGLMGYQVPIVYGISWGLPPVIAALLVVSSPLVVTSLSPWLLNEKLKTSQIIGIALSVSGVGVLMIPRFLSQGPLWTPWALVALLAPICWAGYTLWMKNELKATGHSPLALSGWMMFLATLMAAPLCLAVEPNSFVALANLDSWGLLSILYLGVLATAGGQLVWNWSLKQLPASTVSVSLYLVPVTASVTAWYFRDQALTWLLLIGGSLVIFGLVLVQKNQAVEN